MSCEHPLTISFTNRLTHKVEVVDVPCGKCKQCLLRKQREFAVLAYLATKNASSLDFVTLTYSNNSLPLCHSEALSDQKRRYRFLEEPERSAELLKCLDDNKVAHHVVVGDYELCPSLRRNDVRLWLKRCRVEWSRLGHPLPSGVYAAFGEYGSNTFRPHYHLLLIDFPFDFVNFCLASWNKDFGFSDLRKIPRFNKDGSDAYRRVSIYVAKYVSKDKGHFPFLVDGVAESPRRFSSRNFGVSNLDRKFLRSWYLALDVPESERLARIAERSSYFPLNGFKYPLPRRIREKVYYFKSKKTDSEGKTVSRYLGSTLSYMVMDFKRNSHLDDIERRFQTYSEEHPHLLSDQVNALLVAADNASAEDRAQAAEKSYMLNSRKEKI